MDTVCIRYGYPSDTSDKDNIKDNIKDKDNEKECGESADKPRRTRSQFEPPDVAEVRAYCQERHNSIDPQRFVDFYTANGWVQGKGKPIKDWRAVIRYWEQTQKQYCSKSPPDHGNSSIDMRIVEQIMNPYGVNSA